MKSQKLREEWKERIADYQTSGEITQSAWCKKNGINIKTFGRWYRELRTENQIPGVKIESNMCKPVFLPVVASSKTESVPISIRIGDISVEVSRGFQSELLKEVLNVVMER